MLVMIHQHVVVRGMEVGKSGFSHIFEVGIRHKIGTHSAFNEEQGNMGLNGKTYDFHAAETCIFKSMLILR